MTERIEMLVTVKAYPNISTKYGEVVCVAGVRTDTTDPAWVRLYPVEFRDIPWSQRFRKYQFISFDAEVHGRDQRPESYRPHLDSLVPGEILSTKRKDGWERRRELVEPLHVESMCELLRRQAIDHTSLGVFRPESVTDFVVEPASGRSAAQDLWASQPTLLFPNKASLEEIPYRFSYRYSCGVDCPGHKQSIIDWEIAEAFRTWPYDEAERVEKMRDLWLERMWAPDRDTSLFVGNQHLHPKGFLVLGVFWPPKRDD